MKRNDNGFTPKEQAVSIILDWMRGIYHGKTGDIADCGTPAFQEEVKHHISRLHNIMLDKSGLDGTMLEEKK